MKATAAIKESGKPNQLISGRNDASGGQVTVVVVVGRLGGWGFLGGALASSAPRAVTGRAVCVSPLSLAPNAPVSPLCVPYARVYGTSRCKGSHSRDCTSFSFLSYHALDPGRRLWCPMSPPVEKGNENQRHWRLHELTAMLAIVPTD